jgi:4-amino-4-deoxy-L-arabinose transferase-like glycosyltransferase
MYRDLLLLTGAALVFFFPFLGGVHLFDWDEINFAECAREMVETGNYLQVQLNYFPFWEKPPLFFWLQALSMHLWGVGEYAARFPNAVAGLVTLLLLYGAGKLLFDRTYGLLWAFLYLGSTLPHLYFKSGIIDPWFNLFMAAGLFVFVLGYWQFREWEDRPGKGKAIWYFLGAGGLIGLAMLTKGPVGLLIPGLTMIVYWVYARLRWYVLPHHFMLVILGSLVVAGTWFGLEILANGPWFMEQFVEYQIRLLRTEDAGHGGFPGYHVVVLLLGCFPASVFALPAFFGLKPKRALHRDFHRWMIFLFWVVLILFSLVQSKIIHYSSMAYFPLTYLGAYVLYQQLKKKRIAPTWWSRTWLGLGILIGALVTALGIVGPRVESWIRPLAKKDPFAYANLEAEVSWSGWEFMPGLFFIGLTVVFFILFRKRFDLRRAMLYLAGMGLFVNLALITFIKRVEGYSQRAALEFFSEKAGEEAYLHTVGYKSYAHLFYGDVQPGGHPQRGDLNWLLKGDIDRPVYFSTKIHKADRLREYPQLEEVGEKNGFVFFIREIPEREQ